MIVVTDSCVFEEGGRVVFESNKAGAATAGLGFVLESLLRVWVKEAGTGRWLLDGTIDVKLGKGEERAQRRDYNRDEMLDQVGFAEMSGFLASHDLSAQLSSNGPDKPESKRRKLEGTPAVPSPGAGA